jgi:glutathione synthase
MDPIGAIHFHKDTTLAMLLAAQSRGWELYYMEQSDLFLQDGRCYARSGQLTVRDDEKNWFSLSDPHTAPLDELDVVLMRKDPPVDLEFIYSTFLLERAEAHGALIVNSPGAVRNASEKLYTAWFTDCCPPTRVSRDIKLLKEFLEEHTDIIVKPLNGMGGASVFRVQQEDPNVNVILETITDKSRVTSAS